MSVTSDQVRYVYWTSSIGPMTLWACDEALVRLDFPGHNGTIADRWAQRHFRMQPAKGNTNAAPFPDTIDQLEGYFAGERRSFDLPVVLHGTPFQCAVWHAVREIPWGETRTYRAIATAIGQPTAVRAVGAANGANPLSIIVPCHRLVGSDGALRGYGGGIERKEQLLALEGRVNRLLADK